MNSIQDEGAAHIANAMIANEVRGDVVCSGGSTGRFSYQTLTTLYLGGNKISANGAKSLAATLGSNHVTEKYCILCRDYRVILVPDTYRTPS